MTDEPKYSITRCDSDSIPLGSNGLYRESIICNYTNRTIHIINNNDEKIALPAEFTNDGRVEVEIRFVETNGTRTTDSRKSIKKVLSGSIIKIPSWQINNEPVYVKEFDIVICSPEHVANTHHPSRAMNARDIIEYALERYDKTDFMHALRLFANSQDKSLSKLWVSFAGYAVALDVSHYTGNDELSIISTKFIGRSTVQRIDLTNFDKQCIYQVDGGNAIFIARSKELLEEIIVMRRNSLTELESIQLTASSFESQSKQFIDSLTSQHHQEVTTIQANAKLDLEKVKLEAKQAKQDLEESRHELDRAKSENNKQKIQIDRYEGMLAFDTNMLKNHAQVREANNKAKSAEIGLDADMVKFKETVVKVAGSVILLMIGMAVKGMFEVAKNK